MKTKEPADATLLAARIARAYPSLSAYSSATLAEQLCAIERMQRRHTERCCSGADGGYVKPIRPGAGIGMGAYKSLCVEHDPDAEARAEKRIARAAGDWLNHLVRLLTSRDFDSIDDRLRAEILAEVGIEREGGPRGAVLLVRLPGETEARAV